MKRNESIELLVRDELSKLDAHERAAYVNTAIDEGLIDEQPQLATLTEHPEHEAFDCVVAESLGAKYVGTKNEYILSRLHELGSDTVTIEGVPESLERCPCCEYRTLESRGQYDICPVCNWEDTGIEDQNVYSGPNHCTLGEARERLRAGLMAQTLLNADAKYLK